MIVNLISYLAFSTITRFLAYIDKMKCVGFKVQHVSCSLTQFLRFYVSVWIVNGFFSYNFLDGSFNWCLNKTIGVPELFGLFICICKKGEGTRQTNNTEVISITFRLVYVVEWYIQQFSIQRIRKSVDYLRWADLIFEPLTNCSSISFWSSVMLSASSSISCNNNQDSFKYKIEKLHKPRYFLQSLFILFPCSLKRRRILFLL